MAYHEEGIEIDDALLLLHGLNAHSGTWIKNVPFFAKKLRVIAPSLPSWRGDLKNLDVQSYVEILREFLSKLKIDRTAIVGNSLGGWIALSLMERNQELIDVLILEDSAGVSSTNFDSINQSGIPVLIIWGSDDKTIPVGNATTFHRRIETSTLVTLNGAGHVPHWERPDEFNRLVLDFITQSRGRGSK